MWKWQHANVMRIRLQIYFEVVDDWSYDLLHLHFIKWSMLKSECQQICFHSYLFHFHQQFLFPLTRKKLNVNSVIKDFLNNVFKYIKILLSQWLGVKNIIKMLNHCCYLVFTYILIVGNFRWTRKGAVLMSLQVTYFCSNCASYICIAHVLTLV